MNEMETARKQRLIREAHAVLDRIEINLKHIFDTIRNGKSKQAA
jgi:hypothetical protein